MSEYNPDSSSQFETPETFRSRWTSRRRMSWVALLSMVALTFALFFVVDTARIDKLGEVLTWFYMAMTSIIGFYMGATTWAYIKR